MPMCSHHAAQSHSEVVAFYLSSFLLESPDRGYSVVQELAGEYPWSAFEPLWRSFSWV